MNDETAAERAFRDSDRMEFLGKPLNPFSTTRQRAAIQLGMRIGTGKVEDFRWVTNEVFQQREDTKKDLEELQSTNRKTKKTAQLITDLEKFLRETKGHGEIEKFPEYTGIQEDAAIVMYVMSISDSKCHEIRRQSGEVAQSRFDAWSDRVGVGPFGKMATRAEAKLVFMVVISQKMESEGKPDYDRPASSDEDDEDPD